MNWNKIFPSDYLKADDLHGDVTARVRQVTEKMIGRPQPVPRALLHVDEFPKPLVLNQTNAKALRDAFGDDESRWTGKWIMLCKREETVMGELKPVIRIKAPVSPPRAVTAAPPQDGPAVEEAGADDSDSVPF